MGYLQPAEAGRKLAAGCIYVSMGCDGGREDDAVRTSTDECNEEA